MDNKSALAIFTLHFVRKGSPSYATAIELWASTTVMLKHLESGWYANKVRDVKVAFGFTYERKS